jgi:hypothetical protein
MINISEAELNALGINLVDCDNNVNVNNEDIIAKLNNLTELNITIEDLFNILKDENDVYTLTNGTEVVYDNDSIYMTYSFNGKCNILNVSRHKITKEKWLICIDEHELYITKDHSIMISRDDKVMEVCPGEILDTDFLLYLVDEHFELIPVNSERVRIECVGSFEDEYVYDLEVKDNSHTFVANNILAHNSCVNITKIRLDDGELTIEELFNLLLNEKTNKLDKLMNGTEVVNISKDSNYIIDGLTGKTRIKNVSRRKVSKSCYKIEIPNTESLYITEDHSIIVLRGDELIEVKPEEVLSTDYLINNDELKMKDKK